MGRVNISIGLRSSSFIEVEPGVFEPSSYKVYKNISATTVSTGFSKEDNQSINQNTTMDIKLSFIFRNNQLNILNDIAWVKYLSKRYKVKHIDPKSPRVVLTLGEEFIDANQGKI